MLGAQLLLGLAALLLFLAAGVGWPGKGRPEWLAAACLVLALVVLPEANALGLLR
jgi:hypothetical protein